MLRYRFLRYPEGKTKAVTWSYDDGVRFDVPMARILEKYGMKGTFNLNSGTMDSERKLAAEEVQKELLDHGHEVAVHGKFHKAPGLCRPVEIAADVLDCRRELEEMFGIIIRGLAYPDSGITNFQSGEEYAKVRQILEDLGIVYARTLSGDNNSFKLPQDWYAWMPTAKHTNPQILAWAKDFVELDVNSMYLANRWPRLFYIWGHSYEFDKDNNWDHLEAICSLLSGHADTWYATNMEIYEYVAAYRQLVSSAEGNIIYNPTLQKIWFYQDGTEYMIEPGQTLRIQG